MAAQAWLLMTETTPGTLHRKWCHTVHAEDVPQGKDRIQKGKIQGKETWSQGHGIVMRRPGPLGSAGHKLGPGCAVR